jgi:hypothetical protein
VTASVAAGGVPGAVAAGEPAAAPPPATPLQEGVRDRLQAPAMVAVAPPVGSVERAASPAAGARPSRQESDPAEVGFRRLADARPQTVEAWRDLRERWRAYVASFPRGAHADEARVRTIEAGLEAWKTGGTHEDAAVFEQDRAAYLERTDALQRERVLELR